MMPRAMALVAAGLITTSLFSLFAETPPSDAGTLPRKLTLTRCLEIATQSNPDLLQASTGFTAAEGQAIQLRAILYPQIHAGALAVPPTIYVQVNQFLYNPATGPQLELSRLTRDEAVLNYQQVLTEVVFHVRQAFVQTRALQSLVNSTQDHLEHYRGMTKSSQQLFEAGKIHQSEMLHLQVQGNSAQQQLENARSLRHQSLLQLEMLLGKKLSDDTVLEGTLGQETFPDLDIKKLTEQALRNRADLQMLQSQKLSQTQKIALSTQSLYPTVGFSSDSAFALPFPTQIGGYDINRNFDEVGVQRANGSSQVPLSLYMYWTFFDGGRSWGLKQSSEAQLASQEEALTALKRAIPGEIEQAVDTLKNAQSTLKALADAPTAEQVRTNADLDFDAGKIHVLDKSLIEDTIFQREKDDLNAQLKVSLSASALDHALGHVVQFTSRKNP